VLSRRVADFSGWRNSHKTFESAVERVSLPFDLMAE
jgi:hypothetical protein